MPLRMGITRSRESRQALHRSVCPRLQGAVGRYASGMDMKEDPEGVEKSAEDVKKRYEQIFKL